MSGSAGAAGGRSAIATGIVMTQPRRSEKANTPCANWSWSSRSSSQARLGASWRCSRRCRLARWQRATERAALRRRRAACRRTRRAGRRRGPRRRPPRRRTRRARSSPRARRRAASSTANAPRGSPSLGLPTEPQLTNSTPPYSRTHGLCVWPKTSTSASSAAASRSYSDAGLSSNRYSLTLRGEPWTRWTRVRADVEAQVERQLAHEVLRRAGRCARASTRPSAGRARGRAG